MFKRVYYRSGLDGEPWSRPGNALSEDPRPRTPPSLPLIAPSSCTLLSCAVLARRGFAPTCLGSHPYLFRYAGLGGSPSRATFLSWQPWESSSDEPLQQRRSSSGSPSLQVRMPGGPAQRSAVSPSAFDSHQPGRSLMCRCLRPRLTTCLPARALYFLADPPFFYPFLFALRPW